MRHAQAPIPTAPSLLVAAALAAVALAGCSSGYFSAAVAFGTGTIRVHLTDAPLDMAEVRSVMVTIEALVVYPADGGGLPDGTPGAGHFVPLTIAETFDLLALTGGVTTLLASGEAPAGRYERIRLEVSKAEIVWKNGAVEPLKLESTTVDVPISFDLSADETVGVTLDFDAAASVKANDAGSERFILRPVVTPIA
jgi:hypothetical protein